MPPKQRVTFAMEQQGNQRQGEASQDIPRVPPTGPLDNVGGNVPATPGISATQLMPAQDVPPRVEAPLQEGQDQQPPERTRPSGRERLNMLQDRVEGMDGRLDVVFEALGDVRSLLMGTRPHVPEPRLLDEPEPQGDGESLQQRLSENARILTRGNVSKVSIGTGTKE